MMVRVGATDDDSKGETKQWCMSREIKRQERGGSKGVKGKSSCCLIVRS